MSQKSFFRLLLVEDDQASLKQFLEIIEQSNKNFPVKINCEIARSVKEGFKKIEEHNFDGAIFDLRLSGQDENDNGNEILKVIKGNLRFPIIVYSGYLQDLDPDLREENAFFKCYSRTDITFQELLNYLLKLYDTGITQILGGEGKIIKMLNHIFWNHLASSFDVWTGKLDGNNSEKIQRGLLRTISVHLEQYLDLSENGNDDRHYSSETYILPPIRKDIITGDIIKTRDKNERLFIILSPACDVIERKKQDGTLFRNAELFLLAELRSWKTIDPKFSHPVSKDNKEKLIVYMNNKKERFHFLPPHDELIGYFIDFQFLASVSYEDINKKYERLATISQPFLKDIIGRFSQYYSRQGQPDYNIEEIVEELIANDR